MKRCRLLQFLPLALFILPSVLGQLCPEGWLESPVSDYCFQFNPKRISKTWAEARKACQARLGDLAWYENTEERSFIVKTAGRMSQADPETEAFWVGLTDEVKEGEWKWVSEKAGTGSSLIDWAHNEPNGANSENCGEVLVKSDSFNVGKMNDKDCYSPFPYICKRPKAVVDNCPSNWQQVQDSCYRFFDLEKGWHSAHHDCKRYGAELVTVDNEVQQQYIYDVSRFEDKPVWIGYESFNNNGGLGWKKNGVVLPPPSGKEQETSSEFWSDGKRPIQLRNHAVCAEVVPTSEESRKSWVINNCQAERPYMCKKPEGTCATGWQPHNGTCYQFNGNLKLSWYDAATYCQSQGGEMVTIERKDIQHFLIRKIGGLEFDKNLNIWIGGSDIDYKPKTLHWSNKMAMSGGYTNWLAGQPMTSANNPLCVQMTADQGNWTASERCTAEQTFICQISDRKVVLPPTVAPAKGSCEPGWEGFAFSCYYFSGETASWLDAQKACQNKNAHLVKVNNAREMSFIDRKLTADSWLGLNDRQSEAHWVWHDKTPAKYTNWGPGKPDNAEYRHGEQCAAVMRGHLKGLWDDMICSDKLAYVCQKDIGPKTTSGPITMGPSYGAKCGPFWEDDTLSDYCYQFNTDTLSWTEAQLQCQHNGGELTSITGLHEQQYIAGRIRMIPEMRYFWLGGNDLRFENGWVWNDDSPFAFINWGDGQPESGWNADCMEIDASTGDWKDRDCKSRRGYICKKKGSGLSTTTTTSTTTEQPGSPYCPKEWSLYGKSCYKVFQEKKMWNLAKDVCRREGGDLVSIAGENEANFVAALAGEWNDDKSEFWIGLNALRVVNLFEWSDDSSVTYTSWRPHEPNNHQGKERCISLYADGYNTGKWNDNDCAQWLPYVCKKPAPRMVNPPPVTYTGCPYERATGAYKGSCYSVFATGATWHGAEWACNSTGGYLVAINDHLEQAYISGQIGGRLTVNMEFWTGLSKGGEGTSYEWISGDWVSFTNWDDAHMGNEKDVCVVVSKTYKSIGEWSDRNCNEEKFFICEYKKDGYLPTPATTTPKGQCPTKYGWREYGNYCYKTESFYGRSKKTWSQAREYCIAIGGDLASFHSEDQMRNATSISASSRYTDLYWIGLSKPTKSSNYVWSDNSALDYTNWKAGEPNDHNGREQCVEIDKYGGEWNDVNCNARRDVMCQIRKGDPLLTTMSTVSPTPAPTCGSDSDWLAHKDYCYFISGSYGSGTKSWYDARKYCMQNGGDLASIHDSDENDFLLLETSKNSKQKYWIGLNELDLQSYKWSDGTPTDFIWWEINEPNNFLGGQKCVDFYTSTGHWNDDNCGDLESYICKKHKDSRTTATPAPTPVLQGNCPPGFQGIGNKCFMLVGDDVDSSQLKNYTNAVAACAALNKKYTLASITNPLEQALVTSMLKGKKVDFWLGLNKLILRRFQWTDNSQFDFTYWDYGEPDGSSYGSDREDCVSLTTSGSSAGHWRDRDCDLKLGYLCETWKDPSQPAPPVTQSPASCPRGYDTYGSDCYQMTAAMTWDNAKATCERQGDKLVSVLDSYEEAFLILYTQRTKPQPVWLGMKRNGRSYYWDDGWPVDYANWANSEPSREDAEMCVALMPDGRWNDTVCSASIQAVCKKSSGEYDIVIIVLTLFHHRLPQTVPDTAQMTNRGSSTVPTATC
ncbi:macrophage mannose receptor 1-like [Lingula anatina]|uniref:Macrophage mannose receptor 1-like n=1 Tax=Lingula anatina TaxID=7574 RepID=A0A2R2MKJ9_LINAN|nr:macrophage mannose receptor 1-like [Lingula anatina]|eukprot:XP_023930741.1 macrophage mannose receptor 1-like [Lingula anatina]